LCLPEQRRVRRAYRASTHSHPQTRVQTEFDTQHYNEHTRPSSDLDLDFDTTPLAKSGNPRSNSLLSARIAFALRQPRTRSIRWIEKVQSGEVSRVNVGGLYPEENDGGQIEGMAEVQEYELEQCEDVRSGRSFNRGASPLEFGHSCQECELTTTTHPATRPTHHCWNL
jgi:hypothetical protein